MAKFEWLVFIVLVSGIRGKKRLVVAGVSRLWCSPIGLMPGNEGLDGLVNDLFRFLHRTDGTSPK
ncbi:MAG: hypothetical protein F4128_11490 [Gammaproteobacteria bacterium]|nr:hypothetical protein [Gammaproteobacteria bacterium]